MDFKDIRVLIVDDEITICEVLAASLRDEGFLVEVAHNGRDGLKLVEEFKPDVLLLDIWMPGDIDGLQTLEELEKLSTSTAVIMMSGHGTIETAVKAVKLGAWDFIEKPISMEKILILVRNILAYQNREKEKKSLLSQIKESYLIVGDSSHIQHVKSLVPKLGASASPYLISGPPGVGKTLIARNVHYLSDKASGPFVVVNCAALPEGLHSLELWGQDKEGSPQSTGQFELSRGGTLFLKDLDKLEVTAQDQLADMLRQRDLSLFSKVRVVGSTTENLAELCKTGTFREDLYRKLSTLHVEIKHLSSRPEDIPSLVEHFSTEHCRKWGTPKRGFNEPALRALYDHTWEGNVLELKNFIERVHILSDNDVFDIYDIRYSGLITGETNSFDGYGTFREARSKFEKDYLVAKIKEFNGNISKTSEAIGLERSYLHRKIKYFGIDVEDAR